MVHSSYFPSQTAHAGENALIWLAGLFFGLAIGLPFLTANLMACYAGFAAATLAEGKSIGNRMRAHDIHLFAKENTGDLVDWGFHNLGWMVPALLAYGGYYLVHFLM